jgi:uncharacterized membrane protein
MQRPLKKTTFILLIVLFCGAFLRIYQINFQSLWIDELTTMRLVDPSVSFKRMFLFIELKDKNPPLYYILVKLIISITDYKSSVARLTSAIIGTISIHSVYLLGKAIKNREVGLISAVLAAFNYYLIYYSQEARCYILVFLFTTLSFLFFLRIFHSGKKTDALLYCISTIALIYSHYYGLLVYLSQFVIFLIYFSKFRKRCNLPLVLLLLPFLIIGISFIPWILIIVKHSLMKEFWIQDTSLLFPLFYFSEYFGNNIWLNSLLLIPIVSFIGSILRTRAASSIESKKAIPFNSILLIWVFIVYITAFLISKLYIPLLVPRYTIVVLPAILILIAVGIENIKNTRQRFLLIGLICALSLINLFFIKKHYAIVAKTQLEDASKFIIKSYNNYPIINDRTGLYQSYYLKESHSRLTMLIPHLFDSLKQKRLMEHLKGFWLVGAHNEPKPSSEMQLKLLKSFTKVQEKDYYDCWSQLFIANNYRCRTIFSITPKSIIPDKTINHNDPEYIPLWDNSPYVSKISLDSGKYKIVVSGYGTAVKRIFPLINVFYNDSLIFDFKLLSTEKEIYKEVSFSNPLNGKLKITLQNDEVDSMKKEDRNAFIRYIIFRKLN